MKHPLLVAVLVVASVATTCPARATVQDTVYALDEMVVVGTRVQDARKDLPVSVSILEGESLRSAATVGEALSSQVPGVFVTQRGLLTFGTGPTGAGKLTIRGVGNSTTNSQVLVLVDGRPDFMGIFGHPIMDAYRTDDVERVEVVRGPISALYGTNAMGGAVNIVTRRQRSEGHRSTVRSSLGSYATHEYVADARGLEGNNDYTLSVSRRQTDGHRDHSGFRTNNLSVRVGQRSSERWRVSAGGYFADFYSEEPGPASAPTPDAYADILRGGLDVTAEHGSGKSSGMAKLHGTFGKHDLSDGFRSTDRLLGLVLFETCRPRPGTKLSVGFDLKRYGGKSRNEISGADFGTQNVTEAAPHIHLQETIGTRLIASGGMRWEHHSMFGGVWVPQAGVVLQPGKRVALRASVARGFHSPTVKDLYLPFPVANPGLQPERLWSIEGGLDLKPADQADLGFTVYRIKGKGTIHPVFGGPTGPALINGGSYTTGGVEATARVHLPGRLTATVSYAWFTDPEAASGTPGHALSFTGSTTRGPVRVSLSATHVRDLYGLAGQPAAAARLANYTEVSAHLALQLTRGLRFQTRVENLFDEAYATTPDYPMPGRAVHAELSADIWNRTR